MKHWFKKCWCILTFCLILLSFNMTVNAAYAQCSYPADYDVVVSAPDGGVNLRGGVGTSYEILYHMIPNNVTLHISKEAQASNGNYWGYTYYDGIYGWIALSQVSVVESKTPFEELLVEDILIEVIKK